MGEFRPSFFVLRPAGFDVQPIVRYLHGIPAFFSGAAVRLRALFDRLGTGSDPSPLSHHVERQRRREGSDPVYGAVTTHLRARLRRFSHSAVGAAAHLRTHLDRWSHRLAGATQRLRFDLGRVRRRAVDRWRAKAPVEAPAPAPRLAPGRQWEIVIGIADRELQRVPAIAAHQARAAVQIDAAEHALGRIVADCAKVFALPAAQTARQPAARPGAPARHPLAA